MKMFLPIKDAMLANSITYDHRILRTRLPVRSAIYKQDTGGLVVRWVTTSESPLLYVFDFLLLPRKGRAANVVLCFWGWVED